MKYQLKIIHCYKIDTVGETRWTILFASVNYYNDLSALFAAMQEFKYYNTSFYYKLMFFFSFVCNLEQYDVIWGQYDVIWIGRDGTSFYIIDIH